MESRAFGGLTEKWRSEGDEPIRDLFDLRCVAEVVSRFDVVAIQEVRGNLTRCRHCWQRSVRLGDDHDRRHSRQGGNNERMAFAFDLRRVRPSGLAGELVVAIETGRA